MLKATEGCSSCRMLRSKSLRTGVESKFAAGKIAFPAALSAPPFHRISSATTGLIEAVSTTATHTSGRSFNCAYPPKIMPPSFDKCKERPPHIEAILNGLDRYNPETTTTFQEYVALQCEEKFFDVYASLALLKL